MKLPLHGRILTVSELNGIIKDMLEGTFPEMQVKGEISNLRPASSGHVYFDLKDRDSLISAVMFKWVHMKTEIQLKEGLEVTVRGELSCYVKQGRYQLMVKAVEGRDQGELFKEFERLKKKLAAEGLFDAARKRPLPPFPQLIGVVTSPTGAALRDILTVLKRRSANVNVLISPALVQGETAKDSIITALEYLHRVSPRPDVILLGRGGGSIEDLWPFNEESVARAIAASEIPVISCVGHETDFTIADFAADLRAPTPSAAAELVTADSQEMISKLYFMRGRILQSMRLISERLSGRMNTVLNSRHMRRPETLWADRMQETDRLADRLRLGIKEIAASRSEKLTLLRHKLPAGANAAIAASDRTLSALSEKIRALNPSAVLKRGYSIVKNARTGAVVTDANTLSAGDTINLSFAAGTRDAVITNGERIRRAQTARPDQPSLFGEEK
ncbi:MAG: exodeoxyribonuclease VII large subunit [Elusimicrobiaceae bacterium]